MRASSIFFGVALVGMVIALARLPFPFIVLAFGLFMSAVVFRILAVLNKIKVEQIRQHR